jgi:hypothetical protein
VRVKHRARRRLELHSDPLAAARIKTDLSQISVRSSRREPSSWDLQGLLARVLYRRDPTGLVVSGFPFGTDAAELLRAEGLS